MGANTLHLKREVLPDGLDVDLRVHGQRFVFRFDIPDAKGCVAITDIDRQRMLARIMAALDGKFGKIRLRAEL